MGNEPLSSGDQGKIIVFAILMAPLALIIVGIIPAIILASGIFLMKKSQDFSHIKTSSNLFIIYFALPLFGCLLAAAYVATKIQDTPDVYVSAASSVVSMTQSDGYSANAVDEIASDLRQLTPNMLRRKYGDVAASAMMGEVQRQSSEAQYASWERIKAKESLYSFLAISIACAVYLLFFRLLFFNPLAKHSHWIERNPIFSSKAAVRADSKSERQLDIIKGEKLKHYSVADELTKWAKLKEDGHISQEEFNEARSKLLKRG